VRRRIWHGFLVPPGVWLLALYVVPLGIVVAVSWATTDFLGSPIYKWPFAGWNTSNYDTVFSYTFVPAFLRSLGFAGATTALCLLVGYPVAYVIGR
jgi:spermidine/putrescine transport system permease protein